MSRIAKFLIALAMASFSALPLRAELAAIAHVDAGESRVVDRGRDVVLTLALSQPVPWRVFTLDGPRRLVIDLRLVTWPTEIPVATDRAYDLRMGQSSDGWSRLVLSLDRPLAVETAGLTTNAGSDSRAVLHLSLSPVTDAEFATTSRLTPKAAMPPRARGTDTDDTLTIVLDPGHGGLDPGAEAGGLVEADLMLAFARELRDTIRRSAGFKVVVIREGDEFVPLEHRITRARRAGADVFLSLHADALPEDAGHASGATIYTLSDGASDTASRKLAERHDQTDLLAGIDLTGQDDEVALVLMDLARQETAPRADTLADLLVSHIRADLGRVNSRPRRFAGFSVLKAPDFPSVLIELGFLSSAEDRERLQDPVWRAVMAQAITNALIDWDAAE